jgi:mRNA interferase HigB
VQIVGRDRVEEAYKKHPGWKASLKRWLKVIAEAEWNNFSDVLQTYASASSVVNYVIFNIANNEARLESVVNYGEKRVIVTAVMTHKEYDKKDYGK